MMMMMMMRYEHSTTFAIAGPTVWNSLPDSLRDPAVGPDQFRRDLKTHLFVWHCPSFSALAVFSRNALYKSTFYVLTYLLTYLHSLLHSVSCVQAQWDWDAYIEHRGRSVAPCPTSLEYSSCVALTTSVIRLRENIPPVMDFRFRVPPPVGGLSGPGVSPHHLSTVFGARRECRLRVILRRLTAT